MKSHTYNFNPKEALWLVVRPLGVVVVFAVVMQVCGILHLLPAARPTLDAERTILIHQFEAAQKQSGADIVLLGDSSCMMDVNASKAGDQLGRKVLNLGLLSYLDLNSYAEMLRQYTEANPGKPRAVVLLMHPEALRFSEGEKLYKDFMASALAGAPIENAGVNENKLMSALGVNSFKARVLSRVLPSPLADEYGLRYGFSTDLEKYMDQNCGSLIDPKPLPFKGNAEYGLSEKLQPASRAFRAAVPQGTKFFVAITPVPQSFARSDYAGVHTSMLRRWSQWLGAESLSMPAVLDDNLFAKATHLNEEGVKVYTDLLTQNLGRRLP